VADLASVVADRARFWAPLAEDQGRRMALQLPPGQVSVGVGDEDLAAAVDVLLENVFAHTPDATPFAVTVERLADGGGRLLVRDEGPDRPSVVIAGRGVSGAGSTGLGLDIARRTARSSGGDLLVLPTERGLAVALDFGPASSP